MDSNKMRPDDKPNILGELLGPATTPSAEFRAMIHRITENAAAEYRERGQELPDHVQVLLDVTKPVKVNWEAQYRELVDVVCQPWKDWRPHTAVLEHARILHNRAFASTSSQREMLREAMRKQWDKEILDLARAIPCSCVCLTHKCRWPQGH